MSQNFNLNTTNSSKYKCKDIIEYIKNNSWIYSDWKIIFE